MIATGRAAGRRGGFTLVELMVAAAVSVIIMAILATVFQTGIDAMRDMAGVRRYVAERDGAYHQGTVWPWLLGPFVEAWVRVRGNTSEAKREARDRFLSPLFAHLDQAGLGHVSEIVDGDAPHEPRGCPFQASRPPSGARYRAWTRR